MAESIGKRASRAGAEIFAGPTPVRALGVTDQHSQVQLYVEGPFDKASCSAPSATARAALTEAGRPKATLHFPRVDAHTVGQYLQCMQVSVALMGRAGFEQRRAEIEAAGGKPPGVV